MCSRSSAMRRARSSCALRNWEEQHEPWDARLLLAAADAAGRPHAADAVREWMRATGLEDARIAAFMPGREVP